MILNSQARRELLAAANELAALDELLATLWVTHRGKRANLTGRRDGATVFVTTIQVGHE